jgi:hypothetical protein
VLRCMFIGGLIGVATEILARAFKLWIYRQQQTPILNVILMFTFVMGGVASLVPRVGLLPVFFIAFAIGLLYEIANLQWLDWWYFPDERLGFLRGHKTIVVVIAVLWGAVPVMIAGAQTQLPKTSLLQLGLQKPSRTPASREARLEALNEREKQLIDKLEDLRQRERDVETRLDEIRARKEALLARPEVRRLGARDATPTP